MAQENDLVLIYFEDHPLSFARIEEILPDAKPDWYHVKFLMLQIPPRMVTWILRDVYINGAEFTMDGKRVRLEKVIVPEEPQASAKMVKKDDAGEPVKVPGKATVISLSDLKKNKGN